MSWKFHTNKFLFSKEIILVLMMVFIQSGYGILCYVCDSSVNPGCTNLKTNSSIVPETCTLEKMKSTNSWLLNLNKIAYFESSLRTIPTMFCQKVVAKQTMDSPPVTARFCQLDTRDTDVCSILRDHISKKGNGNSIAEDSKDAILLECSICKTDKCNGSQRIGILTMFSCLLIASILKYFG
ncbi:uncharacterized protein LOC129906586 [Episyrphus balteatus]|uniref:uncharacterized protein LOC129906586 n=1 Tax=Episyrphus balteatus TaxID=286459 RepID=UPI0024852299|nr:uncharacterized protein LOC129906586 [Episyrphus balteatus]